MTKVMLLIVAISLLFSFIKSPLMLVLLILVQTILVSVMIYYVHLSFWMSYILILIFLGGMLVIFIYIASLSSNDKLEFKESKLFFLGIFMLYLSYYFNSNYYISSSDKFNFMFNMYSSNMMITTLLMALFLMITLFIIVKISNLSKGPLRKK